MNIILNNINAQRYLGLTRNCPQCGYEIIYKEKKRRNFAEKNNLKCIHCKKKGPPNGHRIWNRKNKAELGIDYKTLNEYGRTLLLKYPTLLEVLQIQCKIKKIVYKDDLRTNIDKIKND